MDNRPKRPKPKTQAGRLLEELEANPGGVCALTLLLNFEELQISHRYADAVLQLRDRGYAIETIPCPREDHRHAPGLAYYVLENYTETLF